MIARDLAPRLQPLRQTIFAEMSALAVATGAINLGQGFPDSDGPLAVREVACQAIMEGRGNQYPPGIGIPQLRHAVARHQRHRYGLHLEADTEVLVTVGASEAITAAVIALVDAGDEVIVLEPWFDIYAAAITLAGGVRVSVPLTADGFRLDVAALRAAVTPRTRMILLNSPHNPTGTVLTPAELAEVAAVASEHDLVVLSDEAYEHLTYSSVHLPIATLPGMAERTLTVGSGGKIFSLTGWKVGWVSGPARLVAAVRAVKQHLTYVSGGPFQYAIAEGLAPEVLDPWTASLRHDLAGQRDLLCEGLASLGLPVTVPQGTYFVVTDVAPLGVRDAMAFCRDLPHRAGVVAIPCSVFFDDPVRGRALVRWAFCKRPAVLHEAIDRLRRALPR